jgi:hypothetical protein
MQNLRVTPALELDRVADELNDRPRKRFAFAKNTNGLLRQYIPKGTHVATRHRTRGRAVARSAAHCSRDDDLVGDRGHGGRLFAIGRTARGPQPRFSSAEPVR